MTRHGTLTGILLCLASSPLFAQDLYDSGVVRTFEITFDEADWWTLLVRDYNRGRREYLAGDLTVDGVTYPDVGIRLRGKAAYIWANQFKKPFKIKMDAFVPDQELYGHDSLRLNNGSEDPTFCREVMMTNLLADWAPMPRANFINLVINGENWGVYVNEQQKDKKFLGEWFEADTGNRYKSVLGGNLDYLGPDPPPYQSLYENQAEGTPDPWTDLIHFCDVLKNTNTGPELTDALWPLVDMDGALTMFASDSAYANYDSYYLNRNNYYMMMDDHHGQFAIVNHDLNLSFGTWRGFPPDLRPDYFFNVNLIPFVKHVMKDPRVKSEYFSRLRTISEASASWDVFGPLLTQYMDLIRPFVYADPKKNFTNADFERNVTETVQGYGNSIPGIRPYMEDRHAYLSAHASLQYPDFAITRIETTPHFPKPTETVTVSVDIVGSEAPADVELRYRARGPFERLSLQSVGGGRFRGTIPAQPAGSVVEYHVVAIGEVDGKALFEPPTGSFRPPHYRVQGSMGPASIVNEFVANNTSGPQDENGEREDWIEFANADDSPLDLSGLYLSDSIDSPMRWRIPDGTTLAPGENLLVWADNEPGDGPLHATFRLDASGEEIALFDRDGRTLLDAFVFGPQFADTSTGRLFEGSELWVAFPNPSPGTSNASDCGTRRYTALDPSDQLLELFFVGQPRAGQNVELLVRRGAPSGFVWLCLALAPDYLDGPGSGVLLFDPSTLAGWVGLGLDTSGTGHCPLTLPTDGPALDLTFSIQAISTDGLSNGVELLICR